MMKRKRSSTPNTPLLVLVMLIGALLLIREEDRSQDGFCGNGPRVDYRVQPTSEQRTYVVLTHGNTNGALQSDMIRAIEVTPDGVLVGYYGAENQIDGLSFVSDEQIETCQQGDLHVTGHVNDILYHEGVIWAATDGDGVYRYQNGEWKNFTKYDGLADDHLYDLFLGEDGVLYAATWEGMSHFDHESESWMRSLAFHDQHLPAHVHSFLLEEDGAWLGTIDEGLYRYQNGQVVTLRAHHSGGWPTEIKIVEELGSNNIRVVVKDPNTGKIWVGSDPGLAVYTPENDSWEAESVSPEPDETSVMDIEFDANTVWFTGSGGTRSITFHDDGVSSLNAFWREGLALELGIDGIFEGKIIIASKEGLYIGTR